MSSPQASPHVPVRRPVRARFVLLSGLFGVLLPLVAIALKGMCAEEFFDPAPSWLHVLLLLLVPLHHMLLLVLPVERHVARRLDLLGGVALGVSTLYTLVFAPLMPLGVVAIACFGLGLLPLSPLGALIAGIVTQRRMYAARPAGSAERPLLRTGLGVVLGVLLLLVAEAPRSLTHYGLEQAASHDASRAQAGVELLRRWADEDTFRAAAQAHDRQLSLLPRARLSQAEVERIHYRVTGAPPTADEDALRWDPNLGGSAIGPTNPRLALVGSRLDGSVDGVAAVSYVEWTMVFRNDGDAQAEARARLSLPPGGVVSRATLWIDGEPREAAFGGAGEVRRAYQNVVTQRRDPLLVTEPSPGVVQLQCFPIEPRRDMKLLLGITFPLDVAEPRAARFVPPVLEARNFVVPSSTLHRAWFESKQPLHRHDTHATRTPEGHAMLAFAFPEGLHGERGASLSVERPESARAWARLQVPGEEAEFVEQRIEVVREPALDRVAIVLDTSRAMAARWPELARSVAQHAAASTVRVMLATDGGFVWLDDPRALEQVRPLGGIDNLPALVEAAAWARGAPRGGVLWIHGDQPVALAAPEPLLATLERGPVQLVHAQVGPGEHALLAALGSPPGLVALARGDSLERDLGRQLARWSGASESRAVRRRSSSDVLPTEPESGQHLVRLWAREELERLRVDHRQAAVALATAHRLVSPVSGAVVLESQAQYEVAGLSPNQGAGNVPSVPEPETWALLVLATLALAFHARQQRRWA